MKSVPDHQVLFVNLAKTGPVLLGHGMCTFTRKSGSNRVPTTECDASQSIAVESRRRAFLLRRLARNFGNTA